MATQGRALDEIAQTFQREFALNHDGRIGLTDEIHISVRLGSENLRTGEIPLARKHQIVPHRLYFNPVANPVHVANDFLEICRRHIQYGGILYVGNHQFLHIRLNQSQFLIVALLDVAIVVLQSQVRDNPIVVVRLVNVDGQRVVVGHCGYDFEQMERVGAHDDFVGNAIVILEPVSVEHHIHQYRVRLVKIDDFHSLLRKCD